MKAGR